jgi:Holliday junction resolvase-like predicted endonuclease
MLEQIGLKLTKSISEQSQDELEPIIENPLRPMNSNVKGDLAEHYAITYLWDKGYYVFKNCGCTGPIDLVAIGPDGEIKLIDVKSYKDSRLCSRTEAQKELGVQYLHFNSKTRKLHFVKHSASPPERKQMCLF